MVRYQSIFFLVLFFAGVSLKILDPKAIRTLMYTQQITGIPDIAIPDTNKTQNGQVVEQSYTISMKKTAQKMLPGSYPQTPIYAYSAQTINGTYTGFPGPTIIAYTNTKTKVLYRNQITGKHILPIDFSEPFLNDSMFHNQVPVIPHLHGQATKVTSDGQPMNFWTASGNKSSEYKTQEKCAKNQAIFIYTNEEGQGLDWYHDHTYGITRQNVYAGLAAFYETFDQQISYEQRIIRQIYNQGNQIKKLYFGIADRSFNTDGSLYYPDKAYSQAYTSWIPQFFGNMITVNGKVWPVIKLSKQKYRLIFLNGCNSRYLNFYFINNQKKLPFDLIRAQSDYYPNPVVVTEFLLPPGARIQILLDLSQINGQVMMKNNAAAPLPDGDPANLIDQFTGSIMKISINLKKLQKGLFSLGYKHNIRNLETSSEYPRQFSIKKNQTYPAFPQGQKVFVTINQHMGSDQEVDSMFLNGISMHTAASCNGSTYKNGQVYDFYVINLTPDNHPIHFHLVNMQKIKSFSFDADAYENDWFEKNGQIGNRGFESFPQMLDPQLYRNGADIIAKGSEKVFRDIIDAPPDKVTVIRVSFSLKDGKGFNFDVKGSRYVWHCHLLQHQDNQMMTYFCLE